MGPGQASRGVERDQMKPLPLWTVHPPQQSPDLQVQLPPLSPVAKVCQCRASPGQAEEQWKQEAGWRGGEEVSRIGQQKEKTEEHIQRLRKL